MANWRRRRWMSYENLYSFPRSKPKKAKGGIKAQSKGSFAKNWWAKRWLQVLESYGLSNRLSRGRTYARQGQVLTIRICKGTVEAEVQGSRTKPYEICIQMKELSPEEWSRIAETLRQQPLFVAKLLSGEMPEEIEHVFQGVSLSLFPERLKDLKMKCSCPDSSNPCKHLAAVFYLMGEEFDRDPFLSFQLRGITREELMENIAPPPVSESPIYEEAQVEESAVEPLPVEEDRFWRGETHEEETLGDVQPPAVNASYLKRLGSLTFWRGSESLAQALEPIYEKASRHALDIFLSGTGGEE